MSRKNELADAVRHSLERYFRDMDGEKPTSIYDMVRRNIEKPMIETVLGRAEGNQTLAAEMLGINRNTLRKRLRLLGLLPEHHGAAPRAPDGTAAPGVPG